MGQHQLGARVREQVGQALARMVGIERQVGASGLEHREQGDDEVEASLEAHRDDPLRSDAPDVLQVVRQLAGAGVSNSA